MPKALLLHGEPGLGKTLMAKTLIQESERKCFSCKKDRADGAFVDKIRETFENAINNQPSIVFLDDMDKFAQDNLREDNNKEEFVIIQSCFEDLKGKDVFVVATANDILNIPYSLLREGRFGKQMKIEIPNKQLATAIFILVFDNKNLIINIAAKIIITGKYPTLKTSIFSTLNSPKSIANIFIKCSMMFGIIKTKLNMLVNIVKSKHANNKV